MEGFQFLYCLVGLNYHKQGLKFIYNKILKVAKKNYIGFVFSLIHTLMNKIYLKLALVILILLNLCKEANAQYVTIPDANFAQYLTTNFPSCMNNGKLDTVCSATLKVPYINIESSGITDLTGIQYFKNLDSLNCGDNSLTNLSPLPNSLIFLQCYNNTQIKSLPEVLPPFLVYFGCAYNVFTSMPVLPTSLKYLFCDYNGLTSLPTLPDSLLYLSCSNNNLSSLPILPATLISLYCRINSINCLPPLNAKLKQLWSVGNHITCVPNIPDTLTFEDVTYPVCNNTNSTNSCTTQGITVVVAPTIQNILQVYPNPSTGTVTINCLVGATNIKVSGIDGRTIYETSNGSSAYTINLSEMVKGLYIVQVYTQQGVATQKLVLE